MGGVPQGLSGDLVVPVAMGLLHTPLLQVSLQVLFLLPSYLTFETETNKCYKCVFCWQGLEQNHQLLRGPDAEGGQV